MSTAPLMSCPLCRMSAGQPYHQDDREYYHCSICSLVFVLPQYYLSKEKEKAIYDRHENSPDDPGYRHFLSRLFVPLSELLAPHSFGLDFGSGPGPTLSVMFKEAGHSMKIYDPSYAPDIKPLQLKYDFITASEVVEHLHQPGLELDLLWSRLKPNGSLGIMTKRVTNQAAFSHWHYKNDPTHVCFFSIETFRWLADYWCATLTVPGKDVVTFTRKG